MYDGRKMTEYELIADGGNRRFVNCVLSFSLVMQFASFALIRSHVKTTVCDSTILMHSEMIKFVVSMYMAKSCSILNDIFMSFVPFVCFVIMNMLSLWCLRFVSASTFVVIMQCKTLWTAIFSRLILKRTLTPTQISILCVLSSSVIVVTLKDDVHENNSKFLAIVGLLVETILSGFSSVFTQYFFYGSSDTMWIRNVQLSSMSILMYSGITYYKNCSIWPLDQTNCSCKA